MSTVATREPREQTTGPLTVAAYAPGRVCLAGESLDWMTGGPSVVAAVPLHTEVTVTCDPTRGGPLTLGSPDATPTVRRVHPAALGSYTGDGLDYLQATAGIVERSFPLPLSGATIEARSTVPVGAGLSSSAALTVATSAALLRLACGQVPSAGDVAQTAFAAEAIELGTGAGWMDFLACTYGGVCRIDAGTPPTVSRLSGPGAALVLIDTVQRRTTRAVLASKRERFQAGEPAMRLYAKRATEVVIQLTGVLSVPVPDPGSVGDLLNQGHALLRDLVACSTDLIDECADRCLRAGAYGAKLTGSGHGGCLFALAPVEATGAILSALRGLPVRVLVFTTSERHGVVFPPSEFQIRTY